MLTWSIIARACRSASKRAMTWRLSMPGLMTLRATLRCTGCGLLGHPDDAHAAFADLLQQLVRADDRARALATGGRRRRLPAVGAAHRGPSGRAGDSRKLAGARAPEARLDALRSSAIGAHVSIEKADRSPASVRPRAGRPPDRVIASIGMTSPFRVRTFNH